MRFGKSNIRMLNSIFRPVFEFLLEAKFTKMLINYLLIPKNAVKICSFINLQF